MWAAVTLVIGILPMVAGYPWLRDMIPNGYNISSPCNPNDTWQGVGHWNRLGSGDRNPFGLAFAAYGYVWTAELCYADSDGDGKTNGEELGDPNCTWFPNETPEVTTGLSHPGICEPLDDPVCMALNGDNFECQDFNCNPANEPGVTSYTVRLTPSQVPVQETTYMCQLVDLPSDQDYHIVSLEPYIDNVNVIHHILLYGCTDDADVSEEQTTPYACFMSGREGCGDLIGLWAVGGGGICFDVDAAFRIGLTTYKRGILELHWNNPRNTDTYTDGSGLILHITPNLRSYDAGMYTIGQSILKIPSGREKHVENGTCPSECTYERMIDTVNIVGATNHMHYLGIYGRSQIRRYDTGEVEIISEDKEYRYDSPTFKMHDEPIQMRPGDSLEMTCAFKSTSRNSTTFYGEGTSDEMCLSFVMFYPKQNVIGSSCVATGPIAECHWDDPVIGGCKMSLFDYTQPAGQAFIGELWEKCVPGYCTEECKELTRKNLTGPCYQGDLKFIFQRDMRTQSNPERFTMMEYWYKIDSCMKEIEMEEKCKDGWNPPYTGGASRLGTVPFIVAILTGIIAMFL
ncbi:hypothetical protein ACF0H5_023324 [Mactra antiquata]